MTAATCKWWLHSLGREDRITMPGSPTMGLKKNLCTQSDMELERPESEARARKKGLWQDPAPVPPWQYRKTRKDHPLLRRLSSCAAVGAIMEIWSRAGQGRRRRQRKTRVLRESLRRKARPLQDQTSVPAGECRFIHTVRISACPSSNPITYLWKTSGGQSRYRSL
jgi:hypothetical protein